MVRTVLSNVASSALIALVMSHPAATAASQASGRGAAKQTMATTVVNINTASVSELQGLPGVGVRMAERIVEYRQKNGPFKKIEELMNVRGIGEKNFLKLKPQISVTPTAVKAERSGASGN